MPAILAPNGSVYSQTALTEAKALRESLLAQSVSASEAIAAGFKAITQGWAVRRYDQCAELAKAVEELGTVAHRLVLTNGRISIWRKK